MWGSTATLRSRRSQGAGPRPKPRRFRKPPSPYRPYPELLEDRTVLDVGDSLGSALLTGLGPTPGSYTMPSEYLGDGRFKNLDVDLYRLDAKAGQALKATTSAPATGGNTADTVLWLFDANGNGLVVNDNAFGDYSSPFSRIDYQFTADGTYYVGVSGAGNYSYNPNLAGSGSPAYSTGSYRLDLNLYTPTPDAAGDTLATAQDTGFGPTTAPYSVTAQIGDGLYVTRDVDFYKFTAAADQYLTATTAQPAGGQPMITNLELFDANGNRLTQTYNYYSYASINSYQLLAGGTYYLAVSGYPNFYYDPNVGGSGYYTYSTGDYGITVSVFTPTPDAAGDTLATALATGLGPNTGTYAVSNATVCDGLYLNKDVDLYQFQAKAGEGLTAVTSAPTSGTAVTPVLRLFDASGHQLAIDTFSNGRNLNYLFAADGTYYIGVSGYPNASYDPNVGGSGSGYTYSYYNSTGNYNLSLSLVTPVLDNVGDTIATALATGLGTGTTSYTMPSARIGDGTWSSLDVDLFRFTAAAGQKLTAITSLPAGSTNPMDTCLRLFDASGKQLPVSDACLTNGYTELDYVFPTAGTYYIGVSGTANESYDPTVAGSGQYGFSTGDYRLDLSLALPVADNVGDTLATALATGLGTNGKKAFNFGQATIGDGVYGSRDVDLYQFQASAGQTFTATASLPKGSTLGSPEVRLFDASGNELANSFGYNQLDYLFDTAGTYYLGVSGGNNDFYDPTVAGSGNCASVGGYTLALNLIDPKNSPVHQVTPSVRGHGAVVPQTGQPLVGDQVNDVRVNAWLDGNGTVHGTVVWTRSHNSPPGTGAPHTNGYPWYMQVVTLQIFGNTAYVEAVVVRSPQSPGDVGTRVGFYVTDNGNGLFGPDLFNWQPIKGNFTVRS